MKTDLTQDQVDSYSENGYLTIDGFLSPDELDHWRAAVDLGCSKSEWKKMPGKNIAVGDDGINEDTAYFNNVFDQLLNLWQTNDEVKKDIMLDPRIGKMVATLAGVEGIRIWHDQALIKRPWANPTSWHLDTPFWSFSDRRALSIWVALDDVTLENGCLFFIPGSHQKTTFQKNRDWKEHRWDLRGIS